MGKQRRTKAEIAAKLEEADALIAEGKLNRDIAEALGVSVMTYHRWRKTRQSPQLAGPFEPGGAEMGGSPMDQSRRIRELQLENSRLRYLVTDLLLGKMTIEEVIRAHSADVQRPIRRYR